jgi:hypothetical protein
MRLGLDLLVCFVLIAMLPGCSDHPHTASQSRAKPDEFKTALVAYIDQHPGYFIGRTSSESLKDKPVVRQSAKQCALGEFVIFPARMRFEARCGWQGPEPYLYEGQFAREADGSLHVSNVKLTRFHTAPTRGLSQ